jgi:hypothetical protein
MFTATHCFRWNFDIPEGEAGASDGKSSGKCKTAVEWWILSNLEK